MASKEFEKEDKAKQFADKKKKAGLFISQNTFEKMFIVHYYTSLADKRNYQTATIKDLKQLISTLSDDSKIMLAHSEMDGKPYAIRFGRLKIVKGNLVIENNTYW